MNSRGRRVEERKARRSAEPKVSGPALPDEKLRQQAKMAPAEWNALNRAQKRAAAKTWGCPGRLERCAPLNEDSPPDASGRAVGA